MKNFLLGFVPSFVLVFGGVAVKNRAEAQRNLAAGYNDAFRSVTVDQVRPINGCPDYYAVVVTDDGGKKTAFNAVRFTRGPLQTGMKGRLRFWWDLMNVRYPDFVEEEWRDAR